MKQIPSTFLFGATSILGWNITKRALPELHAGWQGTMPMRLVPFCNPYSRVEAAANWPRIRLEEVQELRKLFAQELPQTIIYAGGVCDVEKCENNPDWAWRMNVESIQHLVDCLPIEVRLLYVSSDHVFGGGDKPFDEQSVPSPISVYGRTRVEAEKLVLARPNSLVVRAALAIGESADGRSGHWDWLRYRHQKRLPVTIVQDECRSVMWAKDAAERILREAHSSMTGLRHLAGKQTLTRTEIAQRVSQEQGLQIPFKIITRESLRTPHLGRVELKPSPHLALNFEQHCAAVS